MPDQIVLYRRCQWPVQPLLVLSPALEQHFSCFDPFLIAHLTVVCTFEVLAAADLPEHVREDPIFDRWDELVGDGEDLPSASEDGSQRNIEQHHLTSTCRH